MSSDGCAGLINKENIVFHCKKCLDPSVFGADANIIQHFKDL